MRKRKIKNVLDNSFETHYSVTQKDLYETVESTPVGDFIKIEYNKIPNRDNENELIKEAMEDMNSMSMEDFTNGKHKNIMKHLLNEHKGEFKVAYYKRAKGIVRNESGYLLLQDEDDNWKSVDIRNTISITSMDGIKKTRYAQK